MSSEAGTATTDREIRTTAVDFSFGELLNLHKEGEIIIRPEYQRLFRWSTQQRSRLIESILLGLPIPPIFFIENETGILELIDGLQRTSSILQLLDHEAISEPELVMDGCDILKDLNGKTFEDLDTVQKLKIKRSPIRATVISRSGSQFVKYEMFKRLNTGGSLLSAQEIRNCSSRMVDGGEEFYDLLQRLAGLDDFKHTIGRLPDSYKERRADEELALRYFAVTMYRNSYKGNIEEWLDGLMEDILFKNIDFDFASAEVSFKRVFSAIRTKLGDQAFTRFNDAGEPTGRLAPAYFEAVCGAVQAKIGEFETMTPETAVGKVRKLFSNDDFKSATGPGANTIEKLNRRIEVAMSHIG